MSRSVFSKVLRWELAQVPRRPLFWLVLLLLTAAFIWGALNARSFHDAQMASAALISQRETAYLEDLRQRAETYSQPGTSMLESWQDPTDIDGFSRYFLRAHSIKPHLPLSVLNIGQSDLLPYIYRVKLETPFAVESSYDFEHPRGLALGRFDLGFAIAYLLPVAIIVLVAMMGAFERDNKLLRLIATQTINPRTLLGPRVFAIALWFIGGVVVSMTIALLIAGAPLGQALQAFATAILLVGAYCIFWLTLSFLALMFQKGAAATASALISVWAVFTIAIPLLASFGTSLLVGKIMRIDYINELRRVNEEVMEYSPGWHENVRRWLASRPEPHAASIDPTKLSFTVHMIFAVVERERLLAVTKNHMLDKQGVIGRWTPLVEILSPPTAVHHGLAILAGTDPARHGHFEASTRSYQLALRDYFYPRMQEQVVNPQPPTCTECAGRLTFTDYADIPEYSFPEAVSRPDLHPVIRWAAYLTIASCAFILLGYSRGRAWRTAELD